MNNPAFTRAKALKKSQNTVFDLIVIGGGATGCGIALDAASRGLSTLLIEKHDFAAGTSSKSTKLIHGGLRYLKQLEIGLVRETGLERAKLHELAPHLVLPEKMLLPITEGGTYGKLAASFGVWIYDWVAGVDGEDRRKMLNKSQTLAIEPLLDDTTVKGGCLYAEYRTDDARLTIELVKTAIRHGALALNYCKAEKFLEENGRINGLYCRDELNGKKFIVSGHQVVAAGGPWADRLRELSSPITNGKHLHLTKGVHLVFPYEKLPLNHASYFDVSDGRMVFAIPRGKTTYVGTTDTNYNGSLDRVVATEADANYLLEAIHHAFPTIELTRNDIQSNWAGLRPLIHEEGKGPGELSRKDEIFDDEKGLLAIAGGKLTGYRKMAERLVDKVVDYLKEDFIPSRTYSIPLTESSFENSEMVEVYIDELRKKMVSLGLDEYYAWYLVTNYGKDADAIIADINSNIDDLGLALLLAELRHTVEHELVERLEDFLVRRSGRLYFDIESLSPEVIKSLLYEMGLTKGWSERRLHEEAHRIEQLRYDATHYYKGEMPASKSLS